VPESFHIISLLVYFHKLLLSLTRFDSEFLDRKYNRQVEEDMQSAKSSGIKSTPTFFEEDGYADNVFFSMSQACSIAARAAGVLVIGFSITKS
jgi:protein-disulfide isomerase